MISQISGNSLGTQKSTTFSSGEAAGFNITCTSDRNKAIVVLAMNTASIYVPKG